MEYEEIAAELNLDKGGDLRAAKLLNGLIEKSDLTPLDLIRNSCVVVFGAGPSLTADIEKFKSENLQDEFVLIAADGAVRALLEMGLTPDIQVTDLDGNLDSIIDARNSGAITVVHAHGDNIEKLRDAVPMLRGVIGTTQTEPFGRLHNFGGFTDGDRAVFLAEHFNAGLIVLAGMDFGSEVGEYSGEYRAEFKLRKLGVGKLLLEELAGKSRVRILNLTERGEKLRGIPRISASDLRAIATRMRR
jgi:uncharacterized Rossmann fold enzyme